MAVTVETLGYDPDANDEVRAVLAEWVELFTIHREGDTYDLVDWVQGLSLLDPRLTALAGTNPATTIGEAGAWKTTDAQHAAIEAWTGGDEAAMNAWLDGFVAEALGRS